MPSAFLAGCPPSQSYNDIPLCVAGCPPNNSYNAISLACRLYTVSETESVCRISVIMTYVCLAGGPSQLSSCDHL